MRFSLLLLLASLPSAQAGSPKSKLPLPGLPFDEVRAASLQAEWARSLNVDTGISNSLGMKLAFIPPGRFDMGPNGSTYRVTLAKAYYLGTTEVTLGQYRRFKADHQISGADDDFNEDDRPAALVSWNDAQAFCGWLTGQPEEKKAGRVYSLPTEAQWEWAARAGAKTTRYFGDTDKGQADFCWFNVTYTPNPKHETKGRGRQPVAKLKPNAFGLHDMLGNVWEWCADRRIDETTGETRDPVMRGGSWRSGAFHCTVVAHDPGAPALTGDHIGFRVACGVPAASASSNASQSAEEAGMAKLVALLTEGKQEARIVCIGDSITGVYYHTGGRRAYPEVLEVSLRRLFLKAKVRVINAGISGNTLSQGLIRLQRDVLDHKPHLVTIMYGMNDLTRFSLDEFKDNLLAMIRRCRDQGADVLLCTQNSIRDGGRSSKKLAEFAHAIRAVGREQNIPVADCHSAYEAVRAKDANEWAEMLSDDIHPNMTGHKLFAQVLTRAIAGRETSFRDVGPPVPAVPRTLALLKAGKGVKVLAMPPFDKAMKAALEEVHPDVKVEVTAWPTEGRNIAQLELAAKKVRGMKVDLVIVAVPLTADADSPERFVRSYTGLLNQSLSFGLQQWDVIAIPPSTLSPKLAGKEKERDQLVRRLINAQDLSMIARPASEAVTLHELLVDWLKQQSRDATK